MEMGKERRGTCRNRGNKSCRICAGCSCSLCLAEVMNREAAKMGLQVLFHEKPFAGINGSGSSVSIVDVAVSCCV